MLYFCLFDILCNLVGIFYGPVRSGAVNSHTPKSWQRMLEMLVTVFEYGLYGLERSVTSNNTRVGSQVSVFQMYMALALHIIDAKKIIYPTYLQNNKQLWLPAIITSGSRTCLPACFTAARYCLT